MTKPFYIFVILLKIHKQMKTIKLFGFILMLSYYSGQAQINLVGAGINAGTGHIDILKWQVFDSASVTPYPTSFLGYYMSSSLFDAHNSNYYLTGITQDSSALLSFNTLSNDTGLHPFSSFSNISEIDMSTGKIYTLRSDSIGYISVNEYDITTGTDSLLGVISEPGLYGIAIDAIGFDSNHGIIYYVGDDGTSTISLFSIPVRNPMFSWAKTALLTIAPGNNFSSVNYDNANNILYALNAQYDSANNYNVSKVVEIDYLTGEVISRGMLAEFPAFLVGSSSFDQNSGNLLLVGIDTSFVERMIVFNTLTNTYETGFVPGTVSEIVCDNYAFAQSAYGTVSIEEKESSEVSIFPNPATSMFTLKVNSSVDKFTLKIHTFSGRECFSGEIQNPETEISTELLGKGIYFVTLQNHTFLQTCKLIIQ
jgi:hypothetical protein